MKANLSWSLFYRISSVGFFPIFILFTIAGNANLSANTRERNDEIERGIQNYFSNLENSSGIDVDERRLQEIFGIEEPEIASEDFQTEATIEQSDTIRFSNTAREPDRPGTYTVKGGDTLWAIGQEYGVHPRDIVRLNPQLGNRPLHVGERIRIPAGSGTKEYRIQRGDTLTAIARSHNTTIHRIAAVNNMTTESMLRVGDTIQIPTSELPEGYRYRNIFIWPVEGRISSQFGHRRNPFNRSQTQFHRGLDIAVPMGTEFIAARDGIVIASQRMGGYGNVIFIRHANGYVTVYAHNRKNLVEKGDIVRQGQVIGEIGRTGNATGPHLHFEVRKMDEAMNPLAAFELTEIVPERDQQETASRAP